MSVAESVLTGREMVAFFLADDPSAVGISAARQAAVARVDDGLCAGGRPADGDLLRHEASALPPERRPRGMISC